MNKLVLASFDVQVIAVFEQVLQKSAFRLVIEKNKLQAIWDTFDDSVVCLVMDLDLRDAESLAFLKIVKKIRPRLPLVVLLTEETSIQSRSLAEIGIYYRTLKPLRLEEIVELMRGIEKVNERNNSYRHVSLA